MHGQQNINKTDISCDNKQISWEILTIL